MQRCGTKKKGDGADRGSPDASSEISSNDRESAEALLPPDISKQVLSRVGEGMQQLLKHGGG